MIQRVAKMTPKNIITGTIGFFNSIEGLEDILERFHEHPLIHDNTSGYEHIDGVLNLVYVPTQ
tara:strand:+ start:134 stop:322 length:189 start_codon:yes stop_codon:yes gene_type:complete